MGELIVSTNKCFNRQLSADNKKPPGLSESRGRPGRRINMFLIVARQKTYGLEGGKGRVVCIVVSLHKNSNRAPSDVILSPRRTRN